MEIDSFYYIILFFCSGVVLWLKGLCALGEERKRNRKGSEEKLARWMGGPQFLSSSSSFFGFKTKNTIVISSKSNTVEGLRIMLLLLCPFRVWGILWGIGMLWPPSWQKRRNSEGARRPTGEFVTWVIIVGVTNSHQSFGKMLRRTYQYPPPHICPKMSHRSACSAHARWSVCKLFLCGRPI